MTKKFQDSGYSMVVSCTGSVMDLPALCNLEETVVLSLLAALGGRKILITAPSIMSGRSRSAGIDGRFYSAVSSSMDLVMDWVAIICSLEVNTFIILAAAEAASEAPSRSSVMQSTGTS